MTILGTIGLALVGAAFIGAILALMHSYGLFNEVEDKPDKSDSGEDDNWRAGGN